VSDEVIAAIASAISSQGSELAIAGGKSVVASLYKLVRERFSRDAQDVEVLDAAVHHPGEEGRIADLAAALAEMMARDPQFSARLLAQWRDAPVATSAEGDAVVNNFSGTADKVVQARDIQGGISL